jgi:hypothetical protein
LAYTRRSDSGSSCTQATERLICGFFKNRYQQRSSMDVFRSSIR